MVRVRELNDGYVDIVARAGAGPAGAPAQLGAAGCPPVALPSNTALKSELRRCDEDRFASDSVKATGGPPAPRLALKDEAVGAAEAGPAPALHHR